MEGNGGIKKGFIYHRPVRVVRGCLFSRFRGGGVLTAGPGTVYEVYDPYRLNRIPGSLGE